MFKGKSRLGGVREASKLLGQMTLSERQKILEIIEKENPEMAILLRHCMVDLEDLKKMDTGMLLELLKEVTLRDLSLALKLASPDLKDHVIQLVSSTMAEEMKEVIFEEKVSINFVNDALDRVLGVVRDRVEKGIFILDDSDKYV